MVCVGVWCVYESMVCVGSRVCAGSRVCVGECGVGRE